jgi:opacity protein-like surface antigen
MSKRVRVIIYCSLLILFLPGLSKAEKFSLKLSGGMNYLAVGDPNASLKGLADFLKDQASIGEIIIIPEGDFKKIHFGLDFEGDMIVYLNPRFGISLGSGYIYGKKGKDVNKIIIGGQTFTKEVKVSAVPVKLGVYYSLPLSSRAQFFINGGVGYYFAKWSDAYRNEWTGNWWITNQNAKASGIGFHGGVGFELNLVSNIAIVLEGQGRYAKIGGFKGDKENKIYCPPMESSVKGKLYYFEWFPWTDKWYPMIDLSDEEPSGDRIRNVREAKVGFSGFTFRAGIKINF